MESSLEGTPHSKTPVISNCLSSIITRKYHSEQEVHKLFADFDNLLDEVNPALRRHNNNDNNNIPGVLYRPNLVPGTAYINTLREGFAKRQTIKSLALDKKSLSTSRSVTKCHSHHNNVKLPLLNGSMKTIHHVSPHRQYTEEVSIGSYINMTTITPVAHSPVSDFPSTAVHSVSAASDRNVCLDEVTQGQVSQYVQVLQYPLNISQSLLSEPQEDHPAHLLSSSEVGNYIIHKDYGDHVDDSYKFKEGHPQCRRTNSITVEKIARANRLDKKIFGEIYQDQSDSNIVHGNYGGLPHTTCMQDNTEEGNDSSCDAKCVPHSDNVKEDEYTDDTHDVQLTHTVTLFTDEELNSRRAICEVELSEWSIMSSEAAYMKEEITVVCEARNRREMQRMKEKLSIKRAREIKSQRRRILEFVLECVVEEREERSEVEEQQEIAWLQDLINGYFLSGLESPEMALQGEERLERHNNIISPEGCERDQMARLYYEELELIERDIVDMSYRYTVEEAAIPYKNAVAYCELCANAANSSCRIIKEEETRREALREKYISALIPTIERDSWKVILVEADERGWIESEGAEAYEEIVSNGGYRDLPELYYPDYGNTTVGNNKEDSLVTSVDADDFKLLLSSDAEEQALVAKYEENRMKKELGMEPYRVFQTSRPLVLWYTLKARKARVEWQKHVDAKMSELLNHQMLQRIGIHRVQKEDYESIVELFNIGIEECLEADRIRSEKCEQLAIEEANMLAKKQVKKKREKTNIETQKDSKVARTSKPRLVSGGARLMKEVSTLTVDNKRQPRKAAIPRNNVKSKASSTSNTLPSLAGEKYNAIQASNQRNK